MTDERLCKCGMGESFVTHGPCPMGHPRGQCPEGMHNYHDFEEAAPSTDEGEARWHMVTSWDDPMSEVWRSDAGDETSWVLHPVAAAIRAPLEERIRELEADVQNAIDAEMEVLRRVGAENERLREALRDTATHLNVASLVVDTALLPPPPSSTEGTDPPPGRLLTNAQMAIRCAWEYAGKRCFRQPEHEYHIAGDDFQHEYIAPLRAGTKEGGE